VDEIDKDVTAASTGTVADNTGVSQYLLKGLVKSMEDNNWKALINVGPPGTGKTLSAQCIAGSQKIRAYSLDLGAVKGSLVGESEQNWRRIEQIILTMGGESVLWIATANRTETLPKELQRRFWLGTWFWDQPSAEEKATIWSIQRKKFGIDTRQKNPRDEDWTGSDIRNACRMAWTTGKTLEDAARLITVSGIVNKLETEKLRDQAQLLGYRSIATPGPYKRLSVESGGRKFGSN
jgi:SpoVK/Ycf46/Vps4 family AAA+-type ATPase